jgi:hypothetical protein
MPLHTFAACRRCSFEADLTGQPPALLARLEARPAVCGKCGAPMALVRLFPGLLAMPVPVFDARLAYGRAGSVRAGRPAA